MATIFSLIFFTTSVNRGSSFSGFLCFSPLLWFYLGTISSSAPFGRRNHLHSTFRRCLTPNRPDGGLRGLKGFVLGCVDYFFELKHFTHKLSAMGWRYRVEKCLSSGGVGAWGWQACFVCWWGGGLGET